MPTKDTTAARAASLKTFAARRRAKAIAELEAQGYEVQLTRRLPYGAILKVATKPVDEREELATTQPTGR